MGGARAGEVAGFAHRQHADKREVVEFACVVSGSETENTSVKQRQFDTRGVAGFANG